MQTDTPQFYTSIVATMACLVLMALLLLSEINAVNDIKAFQSAA